jgi:flagella basal body P-ring formation protein FlgA
MRCLWLIAQLLPGPTFAGVLAAAHVLPAGTVIAPADLRVIDSDLPGIDDPSQILGQQARITIYAGRPIQKSMLRAPILVSRNQLVLLKFRRGPMEITIQARALSAGAAGDLIRVMNIDNHGTVAARVLPDGTLTTAN